AHEIERKLSSVNAARHASATSSARGASERRGGTASSVTASSASSTSPPGAQCVSGYPAWSADHATKSKSATAAGTVVGSSRRVAASRDLSGVRSATSREGTFGRAVRTLVYHDIAPRERRDEVGFPGALAARYKLE